MKGLILKDLMCLRKQLTSFCFVMAGVLVASVMYVLSARFGAMAKVGQEMLKESASQVDVRNIGSMVLVMFMLLPIASVGDMLYVFLADGKAGFGKVSASLPLPLKKRMLARFLTIYAMFGIGVAVDLLLAFLLSCLTDMLKFREFFGIIISGASVMSIYSVLVILFCVVFGYGKEQYAQCAALLTMLTAVVLVNFDKVKRFVVETLIRENKAESTDFWAPLDFIRDKGYVLFLIAAAVSVLAYCLAYRIADRKRGVI